jgi:hypothetical protein
MSDKLVFDLSQEIDGSPNIFVKKDWLNILDNMNGNYGSNQSILDTSQLSNSNKWMSYREGYLLVPMILTWGAAPGTKTISGNTGSDAAARSPDYAVGLKNWFGSVIHSYSLDLNGTTIIQQTPFINMFNSFKLLTSFSQNDVSTLGATIGFFPDNPLTWTLESSAGNLGGSVAGIANHTTRQGFGTTTGVFNDYLSGKGNDGFRNRIQFINYDPQGVPNTSTYSTLLSAQNTATLWKSHILKKGATAIPFVQIAITGIIYLKHIHSFFQMVPLLKGVYMKMTMVLNQSNTQINAVATTNTATANVATSISFAGVSVPSGGVNPVMIASAAANQGGNGIYFAANATADAAGMIPYYANLSIGSRCLSTTLPTDQFVSGPISNIYLYVPAYSFNPIFESSYLSSPIKSIKYTDLYQYQVVNVAAGGTFNSLLTNGIANIKSVLVIPFFSSQATATPASPVAGGPAGLAGIPVYQSPFDPAGCGPTSPLCHFTNFNVVVSGQNAIYNTQRYAFEEWNNQLYGTNAVNGGEIDGLTSGLINQLGWEMNYCYYYVNVSRMLPVEEAVPKSVQIIGQNLSGCSVDLMCFIEYGCSVDIDVLSGARV